MPSTFTGATTDYVQFGGGAFPSSSEICFSAGCGGSFIPTVYGPNVSGPTGTGILTNVWCVDYQLDVTSGSTYEANIATLNAIGTPTDPNVRYGNLDSVDPTGAAPGGWANSLTAPAGIDSNSAAYRYTLTAALVSQYVDSTSTPNPTNLQGGSLVNRAIQEAIWYITYNSDYETNATWATIAPGDIGPATCGAGETVSSAGGNTNYACWVKYAEGNVQNVNTSAWAVISAPAEPNGTLDGPADLFGNPAYPAYQTFLVQVDSNGIITHENPTPEPVYFGLTLALAGVIVFTRIRQARKQSSEA
ncbi:MAG TPA: hypothetical protein VG297_25590 [Bryobacteraceae bacterium]|nr:hypothetical protein [Bryobacteraceae bacterium]